MKPRILGRVFIASFGLFLLLAAAPPVLADSVDFCISQLKNASDIRVRTQAALCLGSSQDQRAVAPLCGGLNDANATVRASCAAALGKLKLGGLQCLENHYETETSDYVKTAIQSAINKLSNSS